MIPYEIRSIVPAAADQLIFSSRYSDESIAENCDKVVVRFIYDEAYYELNIAIGQTTALPAVLQDGMADLEQNVPLYVLDRTIEFILDTLPTRYYNFTKSNTEQELAQALTYLTKLGVSVMAQSGRIEIKIAEDLYTQLSPADVNLLVLQIEEEGNENTDDK